MKRLTFEGNFCDIALCFETECKEGGCSQKQVWEKLKRYEDTGFEPEDVKKIFELLQPMRDTGQFDLLRRLLREEKKRIGRNNDA